MIFINIVSIKKTPFPKKTHKNLALIGMLWMALPFYLFAKAEETISSSLAGLFNGSTPIFVGLIAVLIYKQYITRMQKLYLGLGFVGIYLVTFGFNNFLNGLNIGALLALIASISYGFALNIVQPLIKDYGAIPTLKISLRYATLFSLIMLLPNSDIVLPSISDSLFPILLLGIGSSGIAFVSFYNLINDVGAVAGSITVYIIPIFSTIFGFVFLNEYTNNIQVVGIVIVILSAYRFSKIKN
jgi:drug/metabolite transporter (DMT)-like permease